MPNGTDIMSKSQSNIYNKSSRTRKTRQTEWSNLGCQCRRWLWLCGTPIGAGGRPPFCNRGTNQSPGKSGNASETHWKSVKSKKGLVLIILVLVLTHKIKIKKYRFVYIQQTKWSEHVCSYNDRYGKLHNEYHQHVQSDFTYLVNNRAFSLASRCT